MLKRWMRKSQFTETQIIQILTAIEAVRHVKDVCWKLGNFRSSYYAWRPNTAGWGVGRLTQIGMDACEPTMENRKRSSALRCYYA